MKIQPFSAFAPVAAICLLLSGTSQAATFNISYHLRRPGKISLAVYNARGVMARELLHGLAQGAGDHVVTWDGLLRDGSAAPAGNYTWKLLQPAPLTAHFIMTLGDNYPLGTDLSSSGGPGTHVGPYTVAADDSGIYIAAGQTENIESCMVKLSPDGKTRLWSLPLPVGADKRPVPWDAARSIAIDNGEVFMLGHLPAQNIYVNDAATGAPRRAFDVSWKGDNPPADGGKPEITRGGTDMDIAAATLVVAYGGHDTIRWYDPKDGALLDSATVPAPQGVTIGKNGIVYVSSGDKIVRLDRGDHTLVNVATNLDRPGRLAFDRATGELLVYEQGSRQIDRLSQDGKVIRTFGTAGGRELGPYNEKARQSFSGLTDLCADGGGGFFVAEPYAPPRRIAHFDGDGTVAREWYGGQRWAPNAQPEPGNPNIVWMTSGSDRLGTTSYLMKLKVDYTSKTWLVDSTYIYHAPDWPTGDSYNEGGFFHIYKHAGAEYLSFENSPTILKVDEKNYKLIPVTAFLPGAQWNDSNGDGKVQENEKTPLPGATGFSLIPFVDANFDCYSMDLRRTPYKMRKMPVVSWNAEGSPVYGDLPGGKDIADVPPRLLEDKTLDGRFSQYLYHDTSSGNLYAALNPWTINWGESLDSYMQCWNAAGTAMWGSGEPGHQNGQIYLALRGIAGVTHGCVVATDFNGGWTENETAHTYVWDNDGLFVGGLMDNLDLVAAPHFLYRCGGEFCHSAIFNFSDGGVYFYGNWENDVRVYKITGWDNWQRQSGPLTIAVPSTPETGQGLTAEYFDNADFTDSRTTRVDPGIDFHWGAKIPAGTKLTSPDTFSVRWRGAILPTYGPLYTGKWNVLKNGQYFGGTCNVSNVQDSSVSFKFVGSSLAIVGETNNHSGLAEVSIDGAKPERIDSYSVATVPGATLFTKGGLPPGPHVAIVKILGWPYRRAFSSDTYVSIDKFVVDGKDYDDDGLPYTFYLRNQDGAELWLDNDLVMTDWFVKNAASERTVTIDLQRKQNPIQISYFKNRGEGECTLSWSSPWDDKAVVPAAQLFSNVQDNPATEQTDGAIFSDTDTTTRGSYLGKYGSEGYYIAGGETHYPAYAKVNITGVREPTVVPGMGADPRALQKPPAGTDRIAAFLGGFPITIDLDFTDGKWHRVSIYSVDWSDLKTYQVGYSVADADTGKLLSEKDIGLYYDGAYTSWNLTGHVQIKVLCKAGRYTQAFMSGLFFDPPGGDIPDARGGLSALGNGQVIPDGTATPDTVDGADFGSVRVGATKTQTFTIENDGKRPVSFSGKPPITLGGSKDFSIAIQPATSIPPGGKTTFSVRFKAAAPGVRRARVGIVSDSADSPYDFVIGANAIK